MGNGGGVTARRRGVFKGQGRERGGGGRGCGRR